MRYFRIAFAAEPNGREIQSYMAQSLRLYGDEATAAPFSARPRYKKTCRRTSSQTRTSSRRSSNRWTKQIFASEHDEGVMRQMKVGPPPDRATKCPRHEINTGRR